MKIAFVPLERLPDSFAPILLCWRNSEAVRGQMLSQDEVSMEEHIAWYRRVISVESPYRVRVVFVDEKPLGVIYLTDLDRESSTASWGLYIGEERFRGRGLARPMLASLLIWGFEELMLFRMYTSVICGNDRALALYRQAGFFTEGVWRQHVATSDGRKDLYWIGMLREEWKIARERVRKWQ